MDDGKLHGDFHERLFEIFLGGDVAPDHPLFVAFTPERGRKSEKTEFVRKDANDAGPTAHRHVIVLDAVGGGESTAPILFAPRIHTGRIGRGFFEPLGERRMMRKDLENQEREPRVGPRRTAPHVPQIVDHPFAHGGRRDFRERVPQIVHMAALMHGLGKKRCMLWIIPGCPSETMYCTWCRPRATSSSHTVRQLAADSLAPSHTPKCSR